MVRPWPYWPHRFLRPCKWYTYRHTVLSGSSCANGYSTYRQSTSYDRCPSTKSFFFRLFPTRAGRHSGFTVNFRQLEHYIFHRPYLRTACSPSPRQNTSFLIFPTFFFAATASPSACLSTCGSDVSHGRRLSGQSCISA